jgi:ABC-type Fe3+/spermidine/putrescine transport system ATPase subunit
VPLKHLIYHAQPPAAADGFDTMSYLELKNITAAYDANSVLRDFSLSVGRGEFVALLGASGCGKTTALKIVAGLLEQDAGKIWLDRNDISRVSAERREMSLVFQKPLLFPFLTVAENVAFGLKMRNFPKAVIRDKVAEVLKLVQLENFETRLPRQLSGGQEQRVALARAIVTNPRVLLLDEPFSALDARLRSEMRNLIRELQQRLKITAVFVTHDQEEAVSVADRIAFLDGGKLAQISEPKDFYLKPNTVAVARFFGWKILEGKLNGDFIEIAGGKIEREKINLSASDKKSFQIAFHPRRAAFAADSTSEKGKIHLNVKLERVVNLGTKTIAVVSFPDSEQIEIESSGDINLTETFSVGGQVKISIPADAFRLFSTELLAR